MLEKAMEAFKKYTENYDKKIKMVNLKFDHSYAVMDLMGELAFRLHLNDEQIKIARLIGLLHDIGRFEQTKNTDKEKIVVDHAEYGADYLFTFNHIRDFIDDNKYDAIIEKAIRYHNKYEIPSNLTQEEKLFCKMIRDMDKVDIYKQVATKLENKFDAKEVTPEVLEEFKNEKTTHLKKLKTPSDNTIKYLAFIFDINYNESFDILVETDNFDLFLSMVEVSEDSENLWKKVKEICFDKINRGVENGL